MHRTKRLYRFGDLPDAVRFTNCDELIAPLLSIFHGWEIEEYADLDEAWPIIRLTGTASGYRRVSNWRDTVARARKKVRRTIVEAICGFHFEFIDWYVEEHEEQLCIHGAASQFGDHLVVFPAVQKAGKSTLAVQLASVGLPLFCDDVLPIEIGTTEGIALGLQPRIRPPLPPDATDALRRFVEGRPGPTQGNRQYVTLMGGELAPYGTRLPIGGVVLLERAPEKRARLEPIAQSVLLEQLILQNFAREAPPAAILDTLHAVVAGSRCHRLIYGHVAEAASLLEQEFGRDPWRGTAATQPTPERPPRRRAHATYRRGAGVELRELDGEAFLAHAETEAVFKLNATGTALWRLLEHGVDAAEAVVLFQSAFPDRDPGTLAAELEMLLDELLEEELIEGIARPGD